MNETMNVGLNPNERDLLLRGLRFVHSDILLEMIDPTPTSKQERSERLQEVESLVSQLNGSAPANATASV
ncbi:MAG: hypothetical protein HOL01_21445 [Planctomycetaceae bacterium]|jgi:hypothetical protein|nr:hypothetical protein [Planctomycetaceae bacterium]MBT6485211.1 hypothetical protein [Planctomycetaceae bacterium]MBT6497104.1 hypothetical protein [Planctomycetaceae bacterium]